MRLEEYIKNLTELVGKRPELKNSLVIYSIDSEGNGFEEVIYTPTRGFYDEGEFTEYDSLEEEGLDSSYINAVCIN